MEKIGSGSYGSVYRTTYENNAVVIKKLKGERNTQTSLCSQDLQADIPYSLMMEYALFDFKPFGIEGQITPKSVRDQKIT